LIPNKEEILQSRISKIKEAGDEIRCTLISLITYEVGKP